LDILKAYVLELHIPPRYRRGFFFHFSLLQGWRRSFNY